MRSAIVALAATAVLFAAGCKSKCEDAPPSVLLELAVTDTSLAGEIRALEISLEYEGRRFRRAHSVGGQLADGRTTVAIDLDPAPEKETGLRITVRGKDSADRVLAENVMDTTVQPNACNTFLLMLARAPSADGSDAAIADATDAADTPDGGDAMFGPDGGDAMVGPDGGDATVEPDGGDASPDADPRDADPRDADPMDVELADAGVDSGEDAGAFPDADPQDAPAPDAVPLPVCGDGNTDPGETCDDNNLVNGDGCDSNCTPTGCGNTIVTIGEECDDGNTMAGDGCNATCVFEPLRRLITVDNTANGMTLSNYAVLVNLNTGQAISEGKMQPDGDDIRFFNTDGVTPIDYWIASGIGTGTTAIWVEVPSIPASSSITIHVTYRDFSATTASNGDATFPYFADFDSSTLGDNGAQEGLSALTGNWDVVASGRQGYGYEEIGTPGRQSVLQGASWSDVAVSVSVRLPPAVSGGVNGIYMRASDLNNVYFFGPFQQNGVTFGKYSGGTYSALSEIVFSVQRETWHEITLAASGNMFQGYFNGALMVSSTDSSFASGQIGLRTWGTNVRFDDLRVREYRPPEPLISVGPEQ